MGRMYLFNLVLLHSFPGEKFTDELKHMYVNQDFPFTYRLGELTFALEPGLNTKVRVSILDPI